MRDENEKNTKKGDMIAFLKRKNIEISARHYFVDAMGNMALGLFASLLIGTIFSTLAQWLPFLSWLALVADYAKAAAGPSMGVAIAMSLNAPPLVLFSCAAVGAAGNGLGGPVGTLLAVIVATEFGKLVSKETRIDILVTPAVTVVSGIAVAMLVGGPVSALMTSLGSLIMQLTELHPLWMGILVSGVVGMVLTLPISSAALCVMLGLGGIAGGAATAGCCAQMIGFAVLSFSENGWGGFLSQGLGTSMLQMPNIIRNPRVWIAPTLASLVTGPLAALVFRLENIAVGAGMGTCGLVGPLGIITAMPEGGTRMWLGIVLVCFVLPGVLSWIFGKVLRRIGWIRPGDLKLNLG